jgi:hypothetical protein
LEQIFPFLWPVVVEKKALAPKEKKKSERAYNIRLEPLCASLVSLVICKNKKVKKLERASIIKL